MDDRTVTTPPRVKVRKPPSGRTKSFWRRIRKPLARSRFVKGVLTTVFVQAMRLVGATNRIMPESSSLFGEHGENEPGIIALWHGQHLLSPAVYPSKRKLVAMVSRSADAEMNAKLLEGFNIDVVRGSGGRNSTQKTKKGGAGALIGLKKALDAGNNVCMIADIPHGKPRDAGMGIIVLARLSGRPISPSAIATSRRHVLHKTWDKTTINLPFGRCAMIAEPLIYVAADADDAEMERKRQQLTEAMNEATRRAYALVDRVP